MEHVMRLAFKINSANMGMWLAFKSGEDSIVPTLVRN